MSYSDSEELELLRLLEAEAEEQAREGPRATLAAFTVATKPNYEVSWHHRVLCQYLDAFAAGLLSRLMVFMPPRHGKSELVSRRLPAFIFGHDPDAQIIACSHTATLASKMNRSVQRIIDSKSYGDLFPETRLYGKNVRTMADGSFLRNSDEFEVVNHEGAYKSAGVNGGITGMGFTFGIIDDPIKSRKEAQSKTYRDALWEWYTSEFWMRQAPGGSILITLTRWHEDDLAGRLLSKAEKEPGAEQWTIVKFPGVCEDPADELRQIQFIEDLLGVPESERTTEPPRAVDEPLWPEKYDEGFFASAKAQNARDYESLHQQRPKAREGNMFKYEGLPIVRVEPMGDDVERIRFWDLGGSDSSTADYSVGALVARKGYRYTIVDIERGQWSPRERNLRIKATCERDRRRYGHTKTIIERGVGLAVEVTDNIVQQLSGYEIEVRSASGKKETRADPLADQCEAENVDVLEGPWNGEFLEEMTAFPNGSHDDQVDAVSGGFAEVALAEYEDFEIAIY